MGVEEKIDIELFKLVFKAMAHSDNLEIMANHLSQLLVAALEIKGCSIFALNPESDELEPLASFGLSMSYVNKGPIILDKSIADTFEGNFAGVADADFAIRNDRYKLIRRNGEFELYDLQEDPFEAENLNADELDQTQQSQYDALLVQVSELRSGN